MMCWDVDCESNTLRPTVSDLFSPSPGCWVRRWPSTTQPTTALSRCPLEVCHAFRAAFGDFAIHSRAILQGAAMRSPPGTRPNLTCLQQPRAHSNVVRTSARNAEPRCCSFFTFGVVQGSSAFRVLGLWEEASTFFFRSVSVDAEMARRQWRELGLLPCRGPAAQQLAVHFLPCPIQKWAPRDQAFGHTHKEAKPHGQDVHLLRDGVGSQGSVR